MKKIIFFFLLILFSVSFAETIPVIIDGKDFKGEKVGDYIFVLEKSLVVYKDKVYMLNKVEDLYISEELGILFDGANVFNIYISKDFIFSPDKEIVIKSEKKYRTKKIGNVYLAITGYSYNLDGFRLFAYGVYPKVKYTFIELCLFNLDEKPLIIQQNMFKIAVGNSVYYPDSASSIYLSSEGKEVLFRRLLNPKEGVVAYLIFDHVGMPEKLVVDIKQGLEKSTEIKLP